jgi:hypothetical protein
MPTEFNPLPEREQSRLLETVKDIMHNGGRIPQDASNELIMAAILDLNGCLKANVSQSRKNAIGIRWVGAGLALLGAVIVVLHAGDPLVEQIVAIFGP